VVDRDSRQLDDLRYILLNMRNRCALLHNTLVKNVVLIKQPRTSRIDHMY
jgi:hypothetical protein